MVEAFAEVGSAQKARPFFVRAAGRQAAVRMLEQLAAVYDHRNLAARAAQVRKEARVLQGVP